MKLKTVSSLILSLVFSLGFFLSQSASAQYFSRNSAQLPSIGWMAMDSSFSGINQLKWGMVDQFQFGVGYARDLWDLKLWWLNETAIGFGYVTYPGAPPSRMAITFQGGTGIRYNFLIQRWRPFAALMVDVLSIFNTTRPSYFNYFVSTPTWGALRPMLGLEWIFTNDMSFEIEGGYMLLLNFEDPVRHSIMSRLSYRLYF